MRPAADPLTTDNVTPKQKKGRLNRSVNSGATRLPPVSRSVVHTTGMETRKHSKTLLPPSIEDDSIDSTRASNITRSMSRLITTDMVDYSTRGVYGMLGYGTKPNKRSLDNLKYNEAKILGNAQSHATINVQSSLYASNQDRNASSNVLKLPTLTTEKNSTRNISPAMIGHQDLRQGLRNNTSMASIQSHTTIQNETSVNSAS